MEMIFIGPQLVGVLTARAVLSAGRLIVSLVSCLARLLHPGTGCLPCRCPATWTALRWEDFNGDRPLPPDLLARLYPRSHALIWQRWPG